MSYETWYKNNKDERNRRRRERYAKDKKHRDEIKARANKYRQSPAARARAEDRKKVKVGRLRVMSYSIGETAVQLGRAINTIRRWEASEYIPSAKRNGSALRRYTDDNIALMTELRDAIDSGQRGAELSTLVKSIKKRWR